MPYGMVVQLPVVGALGTDEDFDLRTQLERDLHAALALQTAGEWDRSETGDGRVCLFLEAVTVPAVSLAIVKDVLARLKVLHRATVVLETRCEADPDDVERQTLWPLQQPAPARVA